MRKEKTKLHKFSKFLRFNKKYYELMDRDRYNSNVFNAESTAESVARSKRNFGYNAIVVKRIYKHPRTGRKKIKYLVYDKIKNK